MLKHIEEYSYIAVATIAAAVAGFLIEKIVLKRLQKYALKTTWKFDDIIITSLQNLIIIGSAAITFSAAANYFFIGEKFSSYANKIGFSIIVLAVSVFTGRIVVKLIRLKTSDVSGNLPSTSIIFNITRIVILLIGGMLILQIFGVSITPILTALGVGGLAVALALQETLSNLFAGIQIIASNKIRNGDYIKLDSGQEGYITDITWRNTVIRAMQNNMVIVPNSKLSSAIITNYNLPELELSVAIDVGVSYDSDLEKVEQVTIQTAKEVLQKVEGRLSSTEPVVRFNTFADSSINFSVPFRVSEYGNQFLIKHEFIKALHKAYRENNIDIPFPIRTVIMKKE